MPLVTPKKHWSPHKRTKIATALSSGILACSIAEKEGLSPQAMYAIAKRYRTQISAQSLLRSGRLKIITETDKRYILRYVKKDPFISYYDLLEQTSIYCLISTL